ncbi:hypothetical protein B0F90DRAFT_1212783 [Multifurca ochricompacta]|uniref:RRM domain-containing protein n=1 Tax=Multifurca ochricompacta TaxID=376703 RepID=A0AAD4QKU6_9AGAM|nr:hypothetical protein B0F90DRAFT_1212783 [Multifurca ochricompacta]
MLPRALTGTGTGHHLRFAYTHWQLTTCRSLFVSLNPYEEESRRDNSPNPSFTSHPEPVNSEENATSDSPRRNTTQIQTKKGSRTRQTRTLRPLVIPPTFPPTLIPVTPTLEQEETTKTEPSVTVSLTHLPSHTVKADIRPVFQRFGEVKRIVIAPGGTCADVIFTDAREVKRTLRAYADKPLFVRGREIVVFRKHTSEATVGYYDNNDGQATTPQPNTFYSSRSGLSNQGDRHGVIFVSNFPPDTTQEELQEALAQFGKHERFVMRMCVCLSLLWGAWGLPSRSLRRPWLKIRLFHVFDRLSCRPYIACS